jgi:hypothetical protein
MPPASNATRAGKLPTPPLKPLAPSEFAQSAFVLPQFVRMLPSDTRPEGRQSKPDGHQTPPRFTPLALFLTCLADTSIRKLENDLVGFRRRCSHSATLRGDDRRGTIPPAMNSALWFAPKSVIHRAQSNNRITRALLSCGIFYPHLFVFIFSVPRKHKADAVIFTIPRYRKNSGKICG